MAYKLLWIDLEATGNRQHVDPILEIGWVLTLEDFPWTEIDSGVFVVNPGLPGWESLMVDVVKDMHTKNGLIDDARTSGTRLAEVEESLVDMLAKHGKKKDFLLSGSGVGHYDDRMIEAQMPKLNEWFSYADFDIGNIRRMMKFCGRSDLIRKGTTQALPGKENASHRGLDDIRDHIAEAVKYGEMIRAIPHQS